MNTRLLPQGEARELAQSRPPWRVEKMLDAAAHAFRPEKLTLAEVDLADGMIAVSPLLGQLGVGVVQESLQKGMISVGRAREILTWR
jgi:hypothetical protein